MKAPKNTCCIITVNCSLYTANIVNICIYKLLQQESWSRFPFSCTAHHKTCLCVLQMSANTENTSVRKVCTIAIITLICLTIQIQFRFK